MELKRAEVIDFVRKEWNGESCGVSQPLGGKIACTIEKIQEQLDSAADMIFYMKCTGGNKEAINGRAFSVLSIKVRD